MARRSKPRIRKSRPRISRPRITHRKIAETVVGGPFDYQPYETPRQEATRPEEFERREQTIVRGWPEESFAQAPRARLTGWQALGIVAGIAVGVFLVGKATSA